MKITLFFLSLFCFGTLFSQQVEITAKTVVPNHPRLFMLKGEEREIKKRVLAESLFRDLHHLIIKESDKMLVLPELTRNQIGRRILHTSAEAKRRIIFLSYSFRMTGNKAYAKAAEKVMLDMSKFNDWNPSHFLDVAEMTAGLAIGYDWLYDELPASSKEIIARAIQKMGLEEAKDETKCWWLRVDMNWNQVCNAGISLGALALFENDPAGSTALLNRALQSIKLPMDVYQNNGAYPEGYSYWIFGTANNVLLLDMFEKAFKSDFGLCEMPGFMETAAFEQQMEGPKTAQYLIPFEKSIENENFNMVSQSFSFGDARINTGVLSPMYWFAAKSNNWSLLWNEVSKLKRELENNPEGLTKDYTLPFLLVWGYKINLKEITVPNDKMYVGQCKGAMSVMRTSWDAATAIYLGVKAGTETHSHAHMDAGSFVMDANGVRWAMDFGSQNYESLESKGIDLFKMTQESPRWDVFRLNNLAHNTLTFNNKKHWIAGVSTIENPIEKEGLMSVKTDISSFFPTDAKKVERTFSIIDNKYVQIQDRIVTAEKQDTIRWNMLTTAIPKIKNNKTILLKQNGKELLLTMEGDATIHAKTWTTESTKSYDASNKGTVFVGFEIIIPVNSDRVFSAQLKPL
ncbi:MAG: heparinase II/III family protein [Paludibacter sp.]